MSYTQTMSYDTDDYEADESYYDEPDIGFQYEMESAFDSIGWGDDDAYGMIGGDSDLMGEY